jgi:hypothetical protein
MGKLKHSKEYLEYKRKLTLAKRCLKKAKIPRDLSTNTTKDIRNKIRKLSVVKHLPLVISRISNSKSSFHSWFIKTVLIHRLIFEREVVRRRQYIGISDEHMQDTYLIERHIYQLKENDDSKRNFETLRVLFFLWKHNLTISGAFQILSISCSRITVLNTKTGEPTVFKSTDALIKAFGKIGVLNRTTNRDLQDVFRDLFIAEACERYLTKSHLCSNVASMCALYIVPY